MRPKRGANGAKWIYLSVNFCILSLFFYAIVHGPVSTFMEDETYMVEDNYLIDLGNNYLL